MKHISVAGKGGTGKTTLSALLIRYLREKKDGAVLAVDADPNANLHEALGMTVGSTVADILVGTKSSMDVPGGMDRPSYIEYQLHTALVESDGLDLLVMGGPEGPGCYCFPNEMLKHHVDKLKTNYSYLVMDNEAGLEHLSRRIAQDVDLLLVTSDPTARGIRSAGRVNDLVKNLGLSIKRMALVVTMAQEGMEDILESEVEKTGLELAGFIPRDPLVTEYDLKGQPLVDLPEESLAWRKIKEIAEKLEI